jgi:hypothetical protein
MRARAIACVLGLSIGFTACHREAVPSGGQVAPRVSEILRGTDPLQRVAEFSALLTRLGPDTVPALVEAVEQAPLDGGDPELVLLGMWWARFDPQAALDWTRTDRRAQYAPVIAAIMRSWAHRDPKRALAAALAIAYPGQREIGCDAAIAGWDESGLPGLIEAVSELEPVHQQRVADSVARRRVATLGATRAFEWADSLDADETFKEMMAVRVASAAAATKEGGPLAAAWAAPRVRSDDRLSNYPRRIATRWVAVDPEAAMAWLASLPAGADRSDGVAEAFRTWAMRDYETAFAWIAKLEPQPWNEPALAVYTRAIASERPQEAIELAQRISDAELREGTTIVIGQVWVKKDRAAAEAWLATADVSERVRKVSTMVVSDEEARARRARAQEEAKAASPVANEEAAPAGDGD